MSDGDATILISGWRLLPHSYAVVNQFQCLELLRRPGIRLYFNDVPFLRKRWTAVAGLFPPAQEQAIRAIPPLPAGATPDAELRMSFPYDLLRPPVARRTCVFATAEFNSVPARFIAGEVPLAEAHWQAKDVTIITPSNWSREGFIRSGADPQRVVVVPHGVDTHLFHPPTSAQRSEARSNIGCGEDEFVFLNIGTMAQNKGLLLLLKAFADVARRHPQSRLVLKGLDALYPSQKLLDDAANQLMPDEAAIVRARLIYSGEAFSFTDMVRLHHLADCYVAPYFAEGFNLPVLEAAACGVPAICTAGGSTDDFTTDEFAHRIESQVLDTPDPQAPESRTLVPSLLSLTAQMLKLIERADLRERAHTAGPAFVSEKFTWSHIVDRLLAVLLPQR